MKLFSLTTFSLFLALSLVCASPRERAPGTKITKNEAEHIALKQEEGARVTAARLETVEGKKVWSIETARGPHLTLVTVDAKSGHILTVKKVDR